MGSTEQRVRGHVVRVGDLEIGQDLDYQRRSWAVQRVGWVIMVLIVVAALLGVFGGDSVLNHLTLGDVSSPLQVELHRVELVMAHTSAHVRWDESAGSEGEVRVRISDSYLENIQIQGIYPEPSDMIAGADHTTFVFETDGAGSAAFFFRPLRIGMLNGSIGLENGASFDVSQFVYP